MKSMIDVKKCGSLRSMRHVTSRPYEDKSVPHLSLYVQHMNKTKLLKEREILSNRLKEIEKEIFDIDSHIATLRPKLGLPEEVPGKKRRNDSVTTLKKDKHRTKRMKITF